MPRIRQLVKSRIAECNCALSLKVSGNMTIILSIPCGDYPDIYSLDHYRQPHELRITCTSLARSNRSGAHLCEKACWLIGESVSREGQIRRRCLSIIRGHRHRPECFSSNHRRNSRAVRHIHKQSYYAHVCFGCSLHCYLSLILLRGCI